MSPNPDGFPVLVHHVAAETTRKEAREEAGMRKGIEAAAFNWCQIQEVVKQWHLFGAIATEMK